MSVALTKDSIDLGIVISDADTALAFYRDLLGFELVGTMPAPNATMYRLMCGTSMIKLMHHDTLPPAASPPGGIPAATGIRYFTISVSNIAEMTEQCAAAGHKVIWDNRVLRPGVTVSMVEDPDGNWVEFLQVG